ncbi:MAG: hypothetical protein EA424_16410 [Planctomycetaceae bacterium]|nr:MAG: hypothetical protein EA424_16410 [Planctomycetaceae bacterium]
MVSGASGTNVFDTRIADFTALATDEGGAGTGTYQIRTTALTGALGYFELGVSDRPVEMPRDLALGTFVAGHLNHLADEDVYTFAALAGDVVRGEFVAAVDGRLQFCGLDAGAGSGADRDRIWRRPAGADRHPGGRGRFRLGGGRAAGWAGGVGGGLERRQPVVEQFPGSAGLVRTG